MMEDANYSNYAPNPMNDPRYREIFQEVERHDNPKPVPSIPCEEYVDQDLEAAKKVTGELKELALQAEKLLNLQRTAKAVVEDRKPGPKASFPVSFSAAEQDLLRNLGLDPAGDPQKILHHLEGKNETLRQQISDGLAQLQGDVGKVSAMVDNL